MVSKKMQKALNQQLNREYFSSYLYLSMSAYCSNAGLNGSANWFYQQYQEEVMHGMKIYDYMIQRGIKIELEKIDKPEGEFDGILDVFQKSLEHEEFMTKNLNELSDIAMKEKDHATYNFLQWFVTEQVEEEASVSDIIAKIKLIGKDGKGLYIIDNELAKRVAPSPTEQTE
jgi:ferritin